MYRRTGARSADPSYQNLSHGNPQSSGSTQNSGTSQNKKRVLWTIASLLGVFLFLQLLYPSKSSSSKINLPGFGFKSTNSRRTDSHLRYDKRRKSAASIQGSSYPPSNFSEPPPFTFCPTFGDGDELGNLYGPDSILRTRAHLGSSERIRKVIRRAMSGLPITIGILGGSVSSCHGLDATPAHPLGNPVGPNCYPHRIFSWLNDVFPHPANELTNGALRRTGTSYFGFCSEMHLPDRVDLVVVEFDTEDPHDTTTIASTDLLVRSLLLRPDQPAVIMLGHFAPQIQGEHGFSGPEVWHASVAQFYDVPHLSVKGLLYEEYLLNPQKIRQNYFLDPILANSKGHELLADTVIAYLESEVCMVWDAEYDALVAPASSNAYFGGSGGVAIPAGGEDAPPSLLGGKGLRKSGDAGLDAEDAGTSQNGPGGVGYLNSRKKEAGNSYARIPPFRIIDRPHTIQHFREVKPNCASANDLINPLPISVFLGSGWDPVTPKPDDEDERHYWYSETPGSTLKIPIKVGAGDIAVYYLKGPVSEGWGTVLCWVDDNKAGGVELKGNWDRDYGQPTVTQVDRGVTKGNHFVVCELQQEESGTAKFKIFGIFAS